MNDAERQLKERIACMRDLELLREVESLIAHDERYAHELEAFVDMRHWVEAGRFLNKKQRAWVEEVAAILFPLDSRYVPRGREVQTPDVLRNLPKRPPGRST